MSEVSQETLERFVTTAENLLASLPVLASAATNADGADSMINYAEVSGFGDTSSDHTINHLPEIVSYESVYLISPNDYILGGLNCIANLQARALVAEQKNSWNFCNIKLMKFIEIFSVIRCDYSVDITDVKIIKSF